MTVSSIPADRNADFLATALTVSVMRIPSPLSRAKQYRVFFPLSIVAATVMAASAGLDPRKPEPFKIDRPFLFYITDDVSGVVLFRGKFADPRM